MTADDAENPLIVWYGDDVTGSAAVMETLQFGGVSAVLFLNEPTESQLARFSGYQAIGVAGTARSQSPQWMDAHLPDMFAFLRALGAPVIHYKICSTLDSAPHVGSIGRAIDIGWRQIEPQWAALMPASPSVGRYQTFGTLFANGPGGIYRLDRHPVMARHPVTPMDEADVCRHVARQTSRPFGLIDLVDMAQAGSARDKLANEVGRGAQIIALDVVDHATLAVAGELIWQHGRDRADRCAFVAGSQGVEEALLAFWRKAGHLAAVANPDPAKSGIGVGACDRICVISGSLSEVTRGQIEWASENGFEAINFDAAATLGDERTHDQAVAQSVQAALEALSSGKDPVIAAAQGHDDPSVTRFTKALADTGIDPQTANQRVGRALGQVLDAVLKETGIRRAVIAGGDTSGHAIGELELFALTALAPITAGAALFRAHAETGRNDGLELAVKGGQMGPPDFFGLIRAGRSA